MARVDRRAIAALMTEAPAAADTGVIGASTANGVATGRVDALDGGGMQNGISRAEGVVRGRCGLGVEVKAAIAKARGT